VVADVRVEIQHIENLQWVVVRTRPRCEKKLLDYCSYHGVTAYLPLRRSVRRYPSRTVEFNVPIFTGYLFCQIDADQLALLNGCQNTAHIIRAKHGMELQLISELRSIQIFEQAMQMGEITVKPEIAVGDMVVIRTGPFTGLSGVVTRWKNKIRMSVNIELVGQSVMLEVDAGEVDIDF
jgi:transcriptional antiterminator RfaH